MSTIKTNNIANVAGTASTDVLNVINGSAKAWVNFNGTGTVAIRQAYNVSSITDNGTGDYRVNFTNALADANYAVNIGISAPSNSNVPAPGVSTNTAPTASNVRITVNQSGIGQNDPLYTSVAIFR